MKKLLFLCLLCSLPFVFGFGLGQSLTSQKTPQNVAVFELELGYANKAGVMGKFGKGVTFKPGKSNIEQYELLFVNTGLNTLGIADLESADFVFNKKGILEMVNLRQGREASKETLRILTDKYKKTAQSGDLGKLLTTFTKGESKIHVKMEYSGTLISYYTASAREAMISLGKEKANTTKKNL